MCSIQVELHPKVMLSKHKLCFLKILIILFRWWKPACLIGWTFFIAYELSVGLNNIYSSKPLCPSNDEEFPEIYWYIGFALLGAFFFSWCTLIVAILKLTPGYRRIPFTVALNVVSMGMITEILILFFGWGGLCYDSFGYNYIFKKSTF